MMNGIKNAVVVALAGVLFGIGMVISGMADPVKVIGFLDITGEWDPSLMFVMGGALAVFVPAYLLLIKPRSKSVFGNEIVCPTSKTIDARLIVGAALFGIGWGLLGVCPGPAVASLLTGNMQVLLFIFAMLVGSFTAKKFV